jgi:hypothetical protein
MDLILMLEEGTANRQLPTANCQLPTANQINFSLKLHS